MTQGIRQEVKKLKSKLSGTITVIKIAINFHEEKVKELVGPHVRSHEGSAEGLTTAVELIKPLLRDIENLEKLLAEYTILPKP